MSSARTGLTSTLLGSGKVLLAGGWVTGLNPLTTADLYDPPAGTFAATGSMSVARDMHTATMLPNGKVLLSGGAYSLTAELYDAGAGIFSQAGTMPWPGKDTRRLCCRIRKCYLRAGAELRAPSSIVTNDEGTLEGAAKDLARTWARMIRSRVRGRSVEMGTQLRRR